MSDEGKIKLLERARVFELEGELARVTAQRDELAKALLNVACVPLVDGLNEPLCWCGRRCVDNPICLAARAALKAVEETK